MSSWRSSWWLTLAPCWAHTAAALPLLLSLMTSGCHTYQTRCCSSGGLRSGQSVLTCCLFSYETHTFMTAIAWSGLLDFLASAYLALNQNEISRCRALECQMRLVVCGYPHPSFIHTSSHLPSCAPFPLCRMPPYLHPCFTLAPLLCPFLCPILVPNSMYSRACSCHTNSEIELLRMLPLLCAMCSPAAAWMPAWRCGLCSADFRAW